MIHHIHFLSIGFYNTCHPCHNSYIVLMEVILVFHCIYPNSSHQHVPRDLILGKRHTLMLVYHCHKPVFTPKIAIFRRAGMREGGLPLPLTFQYLIFMIWRPSDLNLVMISSLASKCQHFKLRGLQFHSIKWLKNGHPKFKVLAFWSQLRYHDQIQIIRSSYQKNQILKS